MTGISLFCSDLDGKIACIVNIEYIESDDATASIDSV